MMQISGFIFDLDGVIVDTLPYHFAAWKRLANELGFDLQTHHYDGLKGLNRLQCMEQILDWGGLYATEAEKLHWIDIKNNWYVGLVNQMSSVEVLPGVREFMAQCQQIGVQMAVVSSSKNAKTVLHSIKLAHLFDVIIDGHIFKKSKPSPDCFLLAAEALKLSPRECIVFEDAPLGVQAARNGGFYCVAVGPEVNHCMADEKIDGFAALSPDRFLQNIEIQYV